MTNVKNLSAGDFVKRKVGGSSQGVVQRVRPPLVTVSFPEGISTLHVEDLILANSEGVLSSIGDSRFAWIRNRAVYLHHAQRYDPMSGLSSSRIEPQPHQVFVAHRVAKKLKPRMILADEVGLGKTIEAGLILKEMRARELAQRVLILTPASLVYQWQSELKVKFNESFEIMDGDAAKHLGRSGANPWESSESIIASLPFATGKKQRDQIITSSWDLIIVDEAHRVRRTKRGSAVKSTVAYDLIDEIKESTLGLLLLSATPLQIHRFELYSLIELIEPGLYPTFEMYETVSNDLPKLNRVMRDFKVWNELSDKRQSEIVKQHQAILEKLKIDSNNLMGSKLDDFLDSLASKHPLAQVLLRNRKVELDIKSKREPFKIKVPLSNDEKAIHEKVEEYLRYGHQLSRREKNPTLGFLMTTYYRMLTSSSFALRQSIINRRNKLQQVRGNESNWQSQIEEGLVSPDEVVEITGLIDAAERTFGTIEELDYEINILEELIDGLADLRDTKAIKLLELIGRIVGKEPNAKIVIFTQFVRTIEFLVDCLQRLNGYSCAIFHGELNSDEKEEQIKLFRNSVQILISSEAGGEGRNLQFAHHLINYDLPWNPMKVEQRIGRLDRIGQKFPVRIYNFAYVESIEERVLELLEERIGIFESSVGSLDPILGDIEKEISDIVFLKEEQQKEKLEELQIDLEMRIAEARNAERMFSDLMLDRSSFRRDKANELLEQGSMANHEDLKHFCEEAITYLGGRVDRHVHLGDQIALTESAARILKLHKRSFVGTFNPEIASRNEELGFFSFGHELVENLINHFVSKDSAGLNCREAIDVPQGEWLEVVKRVKIGGLRPGAIIFQGLINGDGETYIRKMQRIDLQSPPVQISDIPSWVMEAREEIEIAMDTQVLETREQFHRVDEETRAEELERTKRIFDQKQIRIGEDIELQKMWLRENELSNDKKIQKIVPARRGLLTRLEKRLEKVSLERDDAIAGIRAKLVEVEFEELWIGLVRNQK